MQTPSIIFKFFKLFCIFLLLDFIVIAFATYLLWSLMAIAVLGGVGIAAELFRIGVIGSPILGLGYLALQAYITVHFYPQDKRKAFLLPVIFTASLALIADASFISAVQYIGERQHDQKKTKYYKDLTLAVNDFSNNIEFGEPNFDVIPEKYPEGERRFLFRARLPMKNQKSVEKAVVDSALWLAFRGGNQQIESIPNCYAITGVNTFMWNLSGGTLPDSITVYRNQTGGYRLEPGNYELVHYVEYYGNACTNEAFDYFVGKNLVVKKYRKVFEENNKEGISAPTGTTQEHIFPIREVKVIEKLVTID